MKTSDRRKLALFSFSVLCATLLYGQRTEQLLKSDWKFSHDDNPSQALPEFDDSEWQTVQVPHDWAISGPFDKEIDLQTVAIVQDGETVPTEKTGRSGALPWTGVGWYRLRFDTPPNTGRCWLYFDGAMSEPRVYVNGQLAGEWKNGYSPFYVDVTQFVNAAGKSNTLAVRLQNVEESTRWYPGGGLYRPVTLISTDSRAIKPWSLDMRTLHIDRDRGLARVRFDMAATGCEGQHLSAQFQTDVEGKLYTTIIPLSEEGEASMECDLQHVTFWSPETPACYRMAVRIVGTDGSGNVVRTYDERQFTYGVRTINVDSVNGFQLNGVSRKLKGVCLHHDLGMIGAAVNKAALAHQLRLLKSMGCDAIRTSHNMPSQWQMELCDSMGLMVMAESFDAWVRPKCKNDYNRFFQDWWERDLTNLVLANRMHPSVVMWSIGNEISDHDTKEGMEQTRRMRDLIRRLDPTRPVTAGINGVDKAISSGTAQELDIPGWNYHTGHYEKAHRLLRHGFLLGSETASTVSSRGVYKFPVVRRKSYQYEDGQCSGYDVECCSWSNLPDDDWAKQEDLPWMIGEFVWTGFDYLGEPTPYSTYWPSRSSYFGIFDLAGLPKDRYYLYRSHWKPEVETIHLVPHWTWPGREGQVTPVYCYTNHPTAELFVNGKSQGKITRGSERRGLDRFRLRWNDVVYEAGEIRVVVYDENGNPVGERATRTAGKPSRIRLKADRAVLSADGDDMAFITVTVEDKDGNLCPDAGNRCEVAVKGACEFAGICNGDATSLEVFTQPVMHTFKGMLSVGIRTKEKAGDIRVKVRSKGLKTGVIHLKAK